MIKKVLLNPINKKIYEQLIKFSAFKKILSPIANKVSIDYLKNTKARLEKISPTFCSAKWLQSTLHLEIGETHSCHHPKRHPLEIEEVKKNLNRLHNTKIKEEARKEMIHGIFPVECEYCIRVEKNGDISDRIYKSASDWAICDLENLTTEESIKNIQPTYLEVSFSSDCNLKCAYCFPEVSSAIRKEIEKFGPYKTTGHFQNLDEYRKNVIDLSPYFFNWLDTGLLNDLKVLRITGGEPFISKNTFLLINKIKNSKEKLKLEFSINSNFMIGNDLIKKTFFDLKEICDHKKVSHFRLFLSIDTWNKDAEFLRFGLNTSSFLKNIETALEIIPSLDITFMITYQALSPFSFNQLLEVILDLKKRYPKSNIKTGISNLLNPSFLSIFILNNDFQREIENNLNFMKERILTAKYPHGFSNFEIQHLERIYHAFSNHKSVSAIDLRDFKSFITEYEKRRDVSFKNVFSHSPKLINYIYQETS